jgi:hypothetical protein
MDDRGQAEGTDPQEHLHQGLAAPQANEVVVDDAGAEPTYANFCRVMATPEEVILDFGLNLQPFSPGRQDVRANHRIVMTPYTTKRLLTAIVMTIQRHEQTFGEIELDVNRRVGSQSPRPMPPGGPGPAGRPEVIRL